VWTNTPFVIFESKNLGIPRKAEPNSQGSLAETRLATSRGVMGSQKGEKGQAEPTI
jgi:hypothetical protein